MSINIKGKTVYGKRSVLITPDMIDSVDIGTDITGTTYNITTDNDGYAVVTTTFIATGCPANLGCWVKIKDIIPWTTIHCGFIATGTAACWGWNGNNGYGAGIGDKTGNLLAYSETYGDYTSNELNVWNLPQFKKYFSACDNNTDNYMRYNSIRGFDMYCRRKNMSSLAGPSHGRTCSGAGTIVIKNIRIVI